RMLRSRKDAHEVSIMKKAAAIGSTAIASVRQSIFVGWTEREIAFALEVAAREAGADGLAFDTIVASGKNASLPHAKPSSRKIKKGDFLVIDFGVRYRGYCSDETCTFAFGELTDDQKNAYRLVKQAQDEAVAAIRDGVSAFEIDDSVRRVFGPQFIRYFVHGTGHGVGLEVHEAPRLSPKSKDVLKTGMIVTVEPGLYFPGKWGIRIEDTVLVKEKGCEKITKMNKDLTVIE
ncbi:MAG: M24 family metallopeptidase, partial [Smithellaceae bacterium]